MRYNVEIPECYNYTMGGQDNPIALRRQMLTVLGSPTTGTTVPCFPVHVFERTLVAIQNILRTFFTKLAPCPSRQITDSPFLTYVAEVGGPLGPNTMWHTEQ